MTLLSRKADYALLILAYLHRHAEGGNARVIAEQYHLSRAFVANILKELVHKGYVTGTRGVKGGYTLRRASHEVTLAELLSALEDGFRLTVCSDDTHAESCEHEAVCPVRGPLTEIHRRLTDVLRNVTLAELFANPAVPMQALTILGLPMAATKA